MKYASLVVSCACLLLLQLEMGAARTTGSGPSESLYATARGMGLDAAGLDEIWRTNKPLVITKLGEAGEQIRVTYELSPDRTALTMGTQMKMLKPSPARIEASASSPFKPQEDWEYVSSPVRRPLTRFPEPNFGFDHIETHSTNPFGSGFPNLPFFPNWGLPEGVTPRVETKTEVDAQGRTVTTRTYSGPLTPVSPGHSLFDSLFPDISRAPGPIRPETTPKSQSPPFGAVPTLPAGTHGSPAFLPPLRPPSSKDPNEWVSVADPTTTQRPVEPTVPLVSGDTSIDDFLANTNISVSDIEEKNGELVKTIVDKNGRVLTARFVLSTVKGEPEKPKQQEANK